METSSIHFDIDEGVVVVGASKNELLQGLAETQIFNAEKFRSTSTNNQLKEDIHKHELFEVKIIQKGWKCDGNPCLQEYQVPSNYPDRHRCEICDYDLCHKCYLTQYIGLGSIKFQSDNESVWARAKKIYCQNNNIREDDYYCVMIESLSDRKKKGQIQEVLKHLDWNREILVVRELLEKISKVPENNCLEKELLALGAKQDDITDWKSKRDFSLDEVSSLALRAYTSNTVYQKLAQTLYSGETLGVESLSYHLSQGLKSLPFAWETCYRGKKEIRNIESYQKGNIIIWNAFISTSKKESKALHPFGPHLFVIKVLNGRSIRDFSVFATEEEVLIPFGSCFKVLNKTVSNEGHIRIELEQILIAHGPKVVLWIDDNPKNNKEVMESAEKKGVTVIWKETTEEAKKFLSDYHNWYLFQKCGNSSLRVITDMARKENGEWNYYSGAYFVRELRKTGYNSKVLIYTSERNKKRGEEGMNKLFEDWKTEKGDVVVSSDTTAAKNFCCFED